MLDYQLFSDDELVRLLQAHDRRAFTEIYRRYAPVVYKNAYKLLTNRDEVMDIVHDIFASLWLKREEIIFKTNLPGYLYISARNQVFKVIAHQQVSSKYLNFIEPASSISSGDTDHLVRNRQLEAIIENEIDELPAKMRQILILSRKSNLSHKDIGLALNISEHTVKKQVNNALKILRVKLSTYLSLLAVLFVEI